MKDDYFVQWMMTCLSLPVARQQNFTPTNAASSGQLARMETLVSFIIQLSLASQFVVQTLFYLRLLIVTNQNHLEI